MFHLVSNDQYVFLSFKLHYDWFKPYYNITVRLSAPISIVKLIIVSVCKVIRICLLSVYVSGIDVHTDEN